MLLANMTDGRWIFPGLRAADAGTLHAFRALITVNCEGVSEFLVLSRMSN